MATPPMPPPNMEGGPPQVVAQPPGTDMTGICFKDQLWLSSYPLDRNLFFDYFAISPFYDWTCNNEQLRQRAIHPLDISHLSKMTGTEYMLTEVTEPHLFVIRKQKRDSPEKVTPMMTYYVLDGSIYQAPQLCNVFAARVGRALYHINKAFTTTSSNLEKIGYEFEIEREFVCDALLCALVGMNGDLMSQYIEFIADRLLGALGYGKIYDVQNPFDWMELISLQGKTNFFEKRVGEYQKASVMNSISGNGGNHVFKMDEDF